MPSSTGSLCTRIDLVLSRIVVPLWILTGAVFKLYERVPSNLPKVIFDPAKQHNIDLDVLLRTLIGLEFLAVGVMLFMPRFARAMAIFMLTCFCLILLGEMRVRAEKCGCFGSLPLKPWHMLLIDGSLLAGILICRFWPNAERRAIRPASGSLGKSAIAVVALLIVGLGVAFAVPARPAKVQPPPPIVTTGPNAADDPSANPDPKPVPPFWMTPPDVKVWVGKKWRDLDIFQVMPRWPRNLDHGKHFIVFYKRTCDHCEDMFSKSLIVPLAAPVIAIEIPEDETTKTSPEAWAMPDNVVCEEFLDLPLGCRWTMTTPLTLTIEDGLITCAEEGDFKKCMELQ